MTALLFLPAKPGPRNRWADLTERALIALVLVALLGCKVNYFVVGIVFFGAAILLRRISLLLGAACLVGSAAFLAIALALTGIPLAGLIGDYRIVGACQSLSDKAIGLAIQSAKYSLLLPVLLFFLWEAVQGERLESDRRRFWEHAFLVTLIFAGGTLLLSSNSQVGEIPLLASAALYVAEMIRRQSPPPDEGPFFDLARKVCALLLFLFFLGPTFFTDLKTTRFVIYAQVRRHWIPAEALKDTPLRDLRFVSGGSRNTDIANYQRTLGEGMGLLRRQVRPGMRLNVLLFSNPFQVALGLRPATGGMLCVAENGMSKSSHPSLDRVVGNATHLLVARGAPILHDVFGPEWESMNLELVEQTELFAFYKVPPGLAGRLKKSVEPGQTR